MSKLVANETGLQRSCNTDSIGFPTNHPRSSQNAESFPRHAAFLQNITSCCRGIVCYTYLLPHIQFRQTLRCFVARVESHGSTFRQDTLGSTKVPLWALGKLTWSELRVGKGTREWFWRGDLGRFWGRFPVLIQLSSGIDYKQDYDKNITFCFHPQVLMNAGTATGSEESTGIWSGQFIINPYTQ